MKLLGSAADEISFSDFFRLVKLDVTQTMQNHPVQAIRQFTQIPFIAENTQVKFSLSPRPANQSAAPKFTAEDEAAAWKELDASSGRPTSSSWPKPFCRSFRQAA